MSPTQPNEWLLLERTVRFGEIDAAGVLHFHHLLRWCHEAWEESLERYGINAVDIFPSKLDVTDSLRVALPIIHCEADFRLPIKCGDHLLIRLEPQRIDVGSFQVRTKFQRDGQEVAIGLVRHLAIDSTTRERCDLPQDIDLWLEASSLNLGLRPV